MVARSVRALKAILDLALPQAGIDFRRTGVALRGVPKYINQFREFRAKSIQLGLTPPSIRLMYPIIGDEAKGAGEFDAHYIHQDLWAARKLFERRPSAHVDVGSRVDGFVTSALVFCKVTVVDVRAMRNPPGGLEFEQADATRLSFEDDSVDSLSSLHAIEHFGLGRYGDAIRPLGAIEGLQELARVAAPSGRVYVGLPVGQERVMFNAHRVLRPSTVLGALKPLRLLSFSAVSDSGEFVMNCNPADFEAASYACGLFELTKD